MRKILAFLLLLSICLPHVGFSQTNVDTLLIEKKQLAMRHIENEKFSVSNFMYYLKLLEVKFPEVVLRQSIEETGWWKSSAFKKKHNLFGLSKKGKCLTFAHWTQSVKAYKMLQVKHLHKVDSKQCYYKTLTKKRYSQNKKYVRNLRNIDLTRIKKYLAILQDTIV